MSNAHSDCELLGTEKRTLTIVNVSELSRAKIQMAAAAAFVKPLLEIVLQLSTDRGRGSSVALKSTTGSSMQPGAQKVVLLLDQAAFTGSAHRQRSHAVLTQGNRKATARQPQGNRKATDIRRRDLRVAYLSPKLSFKCLTKDSPFKYERLVYTTTTFK